MKNPAYLITTKGFLRTFFLSCFITGLVLLISCSTKKEPFAILKFTGINNVNNYSKSFLLMQNKSDSINPLVITGSKGDIFACDDNVFIYNDLSSLDAFSINCVDSEMYVNDKIYSIDIPGNDNMIPWFKDIRKKDLSSFQLVNISSGKFGNYLPYLTELAAIRPDAGINFDGGLKEISDLLKIFKPKYIIGPTPVGDETEVLAGQTNLEILIITPGDSVVSIPLPALPALKQVFLLNMDEDVSITKDYLKNNSQVQKFIVNKPGSLDLEILNPLENLRELVISGCDTILNTDLLNNHKNLEVLSVTGDEITFDPALIRVPSLRWMTFSSNVSQERFNSFINSHPDLEIVELIENRSINNLDALSRLSKLTGLTVTDTVPDVASIKKLVNLKYLSLPDKLLDDPAIEAELQKALPGASIVANEGICLGSGWLLLLFPLVLIIRFLLKLPKRT